MRLIDADLLKKSIAKWLQGGDPQETQMVKLDDIAVSVIMEIEEQPTAYDLDKVVEELQEAKGEIALNEDDLNIYCGALNDAIDIVRKGGVE